MAAYFHQDWWDEYGGSWRAAVADYVHRAPERVRGLVEEISTLLAGDPTDEEVAAALEEMGNYRSTGSSPTANADWLREILSEFSAEEVSVMTDTQSFDTGGRENRASPMTASRDLVRRLVADFPSLAQVMEEHVADQEGELLPYLFMADVARWANATYVERPDEVGGVVDWLEREFHDAAAPEKDLIALGFVEAIPFPPEGAALLLRLGSGLTQVARELGLLPG